MNAGLRFHAISNIGSAAPEGIHLLWSPPYPTGHSLDGFTIQRRQTDRRDKKHCFLMTNDDLVRTRVQGFTRLPDALVWATPAKPSSGAWFFRFDLQRRFFEVDISADSGIAAFAANDGGKVVDGQFFTGSVCRLQGAGIATVWVVVKDSKRQVVICGDALAETKWEGAETVVSGLQMPFRAVNPTVGSLADEKALAESLAQPENINGDFSDISRHANAALSRTFGTAAWRVAVNDPVARDSTWDSTPFGLLVATGTAVPAWRRALALGFLDRDGLAEGDVYDYRISGTVPRADRYELRLDFHTVPRGTQLPVFFRLSDVLVFAHPAPVIEAEISSSGPPTPLRKLIAFERLRLILPNAASHIMIDGSSDGPLDIIGFAASIPVVSLNEPLKERTEIDFGTPVNEILIKGPGSFVGLVTQPIAVGLDPHEPVEIEQTIHGIVFKPTSAPMPPIDVAADNLGSAARAARRSQRDDLRGFEISWQAPGMEPALLDWWPPDALSAPPTEVSGYRLERSWNGQPFAGSKATEGLHLASRNADPITDTLRPGADILKAMPPADRPGLAPDSTVRAVEVFEDGSEPRFGELVTYQVASIDAIGRSSVPTVAAAVQLQKLTRPPAPTAPPAPAAGTFPDDLPLLSAPNGVQVRLLQSSDPDLTAAERARVDAEGDLVILRWGWGQEERALDPQVTEFRVYEQAGRLVEVEAEVTGPASPAVGGTWSVPCRFARALGDNELVGYKIVLGTAFVIVSHPAGSLMALILEPVSNGVTGAPEARKFSVTRLGGREADPAFWDNRVHVELRAGDPATVDALEAYEVALSATWISVSPNSLRQQRSFGVAAADAESYVTDRRAAVEAAPRPGNEGPVSAAEVTARHRGRPTLAIADLGTVASLVARRAVADEVALVLRPSNLAPAGADLRLHMRLERASAGAVLPRIVVAPGEISLRDRDGSTEPWPLSTADEAELRAGDADRKVPDKFIVHAAARLADLDPDFEKIADIDPMRDVTDRLPNTPGRWLYRLRAIDAAEKLSPQAQVLEAAVRVPLPRRGESPELLSLFVDESAATATVRVQDRSKGEAVVFVVHSNDSRVTAAQAELATIRNRPDLAPDALIVVRDDRGQRLTLTPVTPDSNGQADVTFPAPDGSHVHAWVVAVNTDGIPSRLIGPLHAFNGIPVEAD